MYKNCIKTPKGGKSCKTLEKIPKICINLQKIVLSCNPILLDLPIFTVVANKIQFNPIIYTVFTLFLHCRPPPQPNIYLTARH